MLEVNHTRPLNGSQIADELHVSRQAVSYSIRKSMLKLYKEVIKKGWADPESPFDVILTLMNILGMDSGSVDDISDFIKLFNSDIQKLVRKDATMRFNT